jgi:peroxiredoxin
MTFDLLSDPGNNVAKTFGIDVAKHNGDDSWTLPMPARFIIDRDSIIRYAEVDPDYTVRPEPSHTIEALKAL